MTALSGLARGFGPLALARIGVGAGEASAAPAAYSLLSDWFPKEKRAAVLGFFSSGIFIGAGLGLGIGGLIVDRWDAAFPAGTAPFSLRGWQAAFLVVGLPGLLLALWVRTLEEPPRGGFGAPPVPVEPHPLRLFMREISSLLPPFTLFSLARAGAGAPGLAINLGAALALALAAAALTRLLGTAPQWIALAAGLYSVFSWAEGLRLKSREDFDIVFRNPPLVLSNVGFGLVTFGTYSTSFWIVPFFLRVHHLDVARVGLLLGGMLAAGGWLGATCGGLLADAWRRRTPRGRLYVGVLTAALSIPFGFVLLSLRSSSAALLLSFPAVVLTGLWIGPAASTVQELVPPRLRATASAVFILHTTILGLALGPYTIGRLSVFTGDLKSALLLALPVQAVAAALLFLAARRLPRA
jgi:MFS family permease